MRVCVLPDVKCAFLCGAEWRGAGADTAGHHLFPQVMDLCLETTVLCKHTHTKKRNNIRFSTPQVTGFKNNAHTNYCIICKSLITATFTSYMSFHIKSSRVADYASIIFVSSETTDETEEHRYDQRQQEVYAGWQSHFLQTAVVQELQHVSLVLMWVAGRFILCEQRFSQCWKNVLSWKYTTSGKFFFCCFSQM